ncbi:helix-turn-helix transcriptional regulator [Patescibacteria group bacterium]|nr:helix-turn-helix transcriptional regulator [Patescibacteria group bacterium]
MSGKQAVVKNNVYALRSARGLTQEALAEAVGVTRQTVISIEKENYTPSIILALNIAAFFGVAVEKVFWITYE